MYFLKKNIPLLSFIILTLVISLFMAVLDLQLYFQYLDAKDETDVNVKKIQNTTRQKLSPQKQNIDAIKDDIAVMMKKRVELQRMFGKIYRSELQAFANEIGTTEDDLLEKFAAYYKDLPAEKQGGVTGDTDKQILDNFFALTFYPAPESENSEDDSEKVKKELTAEQKAIKEKIERAMKNFDAAIAQKHIEYDNNGFRYLLEALGVPRTELAPTFKRQVTEVNERIISQRLIPGLIDGADFTPIVPGENRTSSDKNKKSGVSYYTDDLPLQRETYLACRELQIRLDLFKRMKDSKISKVPYFEEMTDLTGRTMENDQYLAYTYKFSVDGEMNAIRNFLINLNEAHHEYRIYSVRDVQFERPNAEDIAKIIDSTENDRGRNSVDFGGMNMYNRDNEGNVSESYGRTVVGYDSEVRCTLMVDYIIFVADMLPRQIPEQAN